MVRTDSYSSPEEKQFECIDCLERVVAEEHVGTCPECGAEMLNVSLPRE